MLNRWAPQLALAVLFVAATAVTALMAWCWHGIRVALRLPEGGTDD